MPIPVGGAILAHHDDGRCICCLRGEKQIQENEWIHVPVLYETDYIQAHPRYNQYRLNDDEAPGAHIARYGVGNAFAHRHGLFMGMMPVLSVLHSQSVPHIPFQGRAVPRAFFLNSLDRDAYTQRMKLKIAVVNLQSGIGVTQGYGQYVSRGLRYWLGHSGKPIAQAATMLTEIAPDIVLATEIDEPARRTRFTSQMEILQNSTSLTHAEFFPTRELGQNIREGSAILSTRPLKNMRVHRLRTGVNPRVLGQASLEIGAQSVTIFVAHLALGPKRRQKQIQEIAEIIANTEGPVMLGGDFNERDHEAFGLLDSVGLTHGCMPSYPSWKPRHAFQVLFLSAHFTHLHVTVGEGPRFSDHLPLIVEVELAEAPLSSRSKFL